jgi:hypothetical protein
MFTAALITTLSLCQPQAPPLAGPFSTSHTTIAVPGGPLLEDAIDVYWPTNATQPLRLIAFAHGAGGGLFIQPIVYTSILHSLAAWGFVVAAPRACLFGDCLDQYYKQQLNIITHARAAATDASKAGHPQFSLVDFTHGVAISGHSMGGPVLYGSPRCGSPNAKRAGPVAAVGAVGVAGIDAEAGSLPASPQRPPPTESTPLNAADEYRKESKSTAAA